MVGAGLLDKIRKREALDEAFGIRLNASRVWVFRLAMKIVCKADMAEDIAQTALMSAWKKRSTLSELDAFDAWMRKIVVRTAINACQRTKRTYALDDGLMVESNLDGQLVVAEALSRLEPHHRLILALAIGEQLSYREISELMNVPEGTVSSRLNAAKNAFRKVWEEE